jgi:hypothetical protein
MRLLARMQRHTIVGVGGVEAHAAGDPTRHPLERYDRSSDGSRRVSYCPEKKSGPLPRDRHKELSCDQ